MWWVRRFILSLLVGFLLLWLHCGKSFCTCPQFLVWSTKCPSHACPWDATGGDTVGTSFPVRGWMGLPAASLSFCFWKSGNKVIGVQVPEPAAAQSRWAFLGNSPRRWIACVVWRDAPENCPFTLPALWLLNALMLAYSIAPRGSGMNTQEGSEWAWANPLESVNWGREGKGRSPGIFHCQRGRSSPDSPSVVKLYQ